jgi:hypothetical protein
MSGLASPCNNPGSLQPTTKVHYMLKRVLAISSGQARHVTLHQMVMHQMVKSALHTGLYCQTSCKVVHQFSTVSVCQLLLI